MNNDLDLKRLGSRIHFYRTKNNLTQEQLAELIGTNQKHLSRIEGGYHNPNISTVAALAKALNTSLDSFVADSDDSTDVSNLKIILDEIRGMSAKQLKMLRDNINTIKKYER